MFLFENTRILSAGKIAPLVPLRRDCARFSKRNIRVVFIKLILIFILAFFLNLIWEHGHSVLYIHYQGGEITSLILLRAALFDASVITFFGILFLTVTFLRNRLWLVLIFGILFATGLEFFALETGRWAYTAAMPIIPIINTGLTPTIQLGVLAYFISLIVFEKKNI